MKFLKLALLGTAALAAASVSARADALDSLKAAMDSLNVSPVADAPAAAAPATSVVWTGYVRAGVTTSYSPNNTVGGAVYDPVAAAAVGTNRYYTNVRAYGEIKVTAKTETAVGEVGVAYQIQSNNGQSQFEMGNGNMGAITTDDISGWWKMTPNMTLTGGFLGTLAKSSYSWDAVATNWWSSEITNSAVYGGIPNGDPAAIQLAYADGPLSFAAQIEDSNNWTNNSAVGVTAKVGYKMDAIGFDLDGGYWGNANAGSSAGWSIAGGAGYSAGALSIGGAFGTAQIIGNGATYTPGSIYAKVNMSDVAHIELGVTHDFNTAANDGLAGETTFGGGLYYTPVKQLAFGLEGSFQSGGAAAAGTSAAAAPTGVQSSNGNGNGAYTASIISQFMF